MSCQSDLSEAIDFAAQKNHFPIWDDNEDYAFTGAMRVSGVISDLGVGLVFESFEYDVRQAIIHSEAYLIATFPTSKWMHFGNGIYIPTEDLTHPTSGEFIVQFGLFKVKGRDQTVEVPLEKSSLEASGYLEANDDVLTRKALLFKLSDFIPTDWLFSEFDYLKRVLEMPADTRRLFVLEEWEHPSIAVYEADVAPTTFPDIRAMIEALCAKDASPKLTGTPNTSWRQQYTKR